MQVKQLIQWVLKAQDVREASFIKGTTCYSKSYLDSILQTAPEGASKAEISIAYSLIENQWNECQVWIRESFEG